jgi:Fructosamine-3-kinase
VSGGPGLLLLPEAVAAGLSDAFGGAAPAFVTPLGGGMIHHAARVQMPSGESVFVKWHDDPPPGMFAAEAAGLAALRSAAPWALDVPGEVAAGANFLALEYRAPVPPKDPEAFTARFAEGLAALHRGTARTGRGERLSPYGFDADGYLGIMPQINLPRSTKWAEFYRDCRLLPQIGWARKKGRMTPERERLLMGVVERLDDLLEGLPEEVSLLHGDLWSGNFLCAAGDVPVLFDPAAYYGHREMEIAYVELFGGFPSGFVERYHEAWPLDAGYPRRRALHQLYHLLNHWNHFDEPYGARCEAVCREYLGQQ